MGDAGGEPKESPRFRIGEKVSWVARGPVDSTHRGTVLAMVPAGARAEEHVPRHLLPGTRAGCYAKMFNGGPRGVDTYLVLVPRDAEVPRSRDKIYWPFPWLLSPDPGVDVLPFEAP